MTTIEREHAVVHPLIDALRAVPEARQRRGIRHPQVALLALACAAMLCGRTSYAQIAAWGRSYGRSQRALLDAMGFTHPTLPCEVTFYHLFRKLDVPAFERALAAWAEPILRTSARPGEIDAVAIDGKTARGSKRAGAPGAQFLAAVSHRLQQTLGQTTVVAGDEVGAGRTLLADLVLYGRVVTMDAAFTQRDIAQHILDRDGAYLMIVKGNQPTLQADIATVFGSPPPAARHPGGATMRSARDMAG